MIVDTSALLAIVFGEPERHRIQRALGQAPERGMSAVNWFEAVMVVEARGSEETSSAFDRLVAEESITIMPFTPSLATLAREAFLRFGKGRHPARLNFGDCMAYALAKETGRPRLFKGDDFTRTDVAAALPA